MCIHNRCVSVANLLPPLSTTDITGYFSKVDRVDRFIIPDVDGNEAFVVFIDPNDVHLALKFNRKTLQDTNRSSVDYA